MRNIAPFITLIVLVAFFSIASPSFASLGNLENILQQVSVTAIIAVGLTFVILTAEIDLSVAAVANATAIVLTFFTLQPDYVNIANLPMPGAIAIVLALAACFALGLITAFGVTKIGIPSFIMTLAMMQIGAGISAVLVRGQIAYSVPTLIQTLGSKSIFGVPWIIIVAAIFLLVAHLVLTYTRFGRYVYMVGGNREAAEYSGVNVRFIVGAVMVISAMCSGVAGMLGVAYFGSAQQNEFDTFLLDAIAAVVVGGTSLFGGRGGIGNTIVGLFVLGVLNNGLDYVKIDSFLQDPHPRPHPARSALIINVYAERLRTARRGDGRLIRHGRLRCRRRIAPCRRARGHSGRPRTARRQAARLAHSRGRRRQSQSRLHRRGAGGRRRRQAGAALCAAGRRFLAAAARALLVRI